MSGWDASSRPTWDQQSGTGENTQSFGMPDYPEESGGFPSSASPGTPPAIFLQDYDQNDVVQDDFGGNEFGGNDFGRGDYGHSGYGHGDPRQEGSGRAERGQPDFRRDDLAWDDFAKQDDARRGYGGDPSQAYAGQAYPGQDYSGQEYPSQDYGRQDYGRQGPAREQASVGYPAGLRDPLGAPDADHAARMDPALRDFFAPAEARQDYARPGFGQQGAGQQGAGQQGAGQRGYLGQGPGLGPPGGQQANGYRQPARPGEAPPQPSRWDTAGPRQGSRSARRQQARSGRRGLAVVIVIAVVIGAAVGGYLVFHHNGSKSPAASPTTSPGAQARTSGIKGGQPARNAAGYTLTVPRTAGGYHALTSIPAALQSTAGTTEVAIADAALKNGGGKVTGKGVATAYRLSDGQAMTYMGYQGTFKPAKVAANLAHFGSGEHRYGPGTHGGQFACATTPGTSHGTVCVWVTKTTFAVTEFFSSTGPEVVTTQSKAAADTLKVRDSVEVPKA